MSRLLLAIVLAAATLPAAAKSPGVQTGNAALSAIYVNWACATVLGDGETRANRQRIGDQIARIFGRDEAPKIIAEVEAEFTANGRRRMQPDRSTTWAAIRVACREQISAVLRDLEEARPRTGR